MMDLLQKVEEARAAIARRSSVRPAVGIILGTGLGGFAEEIEAEVKIPYHEIPHFPVSTVVSHAGQLILGTLAGTPVVAMEGRFHFYEGYTMQEVTFPVRVMRALGCTALVASNACGGMNPKYQTGDLMIMEDHINLLPGNPLFGKNDDRLGPRFPDMCAPYDRELIAVAHRVALANQIRIQEGVYVAVAGPNLETRAEYRFLRMIGADVVGMSTVPEVIVAVHAGMRVFGISVITDMCLPDALKPAEVSEIIAVANAAEPKLRCVVRGVVGHLGGK